MYSGSDNLSVISWGVEVELAASSKLRVVIGVEVHIQRYNEWLKTVHMIPGVNDERERRGEFAHAPRAGKVLGSVTCKTLQGDKKSMSSNWHREGQSSIAGSQTENHFIQESLDLR